MFETANCILILNQSSDIFFHQRFEWFSRKKSNIICEILSFNRMCKIQILQMQKQLLKKSHLFRMKEFSKLTFFLKLQTINFHKRNRPVSIEKPSSHSRFELYD